MGSGVCVCVCVRVCECEHMVACVYCVCVYVLSRSISGCKLSDQIGILASNIVHLGFLAPSLTTAITDSDVVTPARERQHTATRPAQPGLTSAE